LLLIIAVLAVGVTASSSDRLKVIVAPPATVPIATPQARTAEEQRYLDAVLPLTERLVGEGRLLSALGEARSRNILELRTRSERFRETADEVIAMESASGVPPRMGAFSTALNDGIASALVSIDDAQSAVFRFDWDQAQLSVSTFGTAVEQIASAIDKVEQR